jgi:Flp pilus assembly protein CpaB
LNGTGDLTVTHNLDTEKIMVQAWKADELSEIGIARSSTDPANALDITVRGAGGDVEIFIIALP